MPRLATTSMICAKSVGARDVSLSSAASREIPFGRGPATVHQRAVGNMTAQGNAEPCNDSASQPCNRDLKSDDLLNSCEAGWPRALLTSASDRNSIDLSGVATRTMARSTTMRSPQPSTELRPKARGRFSEPPARPPQSQRQCSVIATHIAAATHRGGDSTALPDLCGCLTAAWRPSRW